MDAAPPTYSFDMAADCTCFPKFSSSLLAFCAASQLDTDGLDCRLNSTSPEAIAGQYNGWSTPYNYLDAYQMQLDTHALVNGSCLAQNDTYDMIVCPSNTYKLPKTEIADLCASRGLPCPVVSVSKPLNCTHALSQ